MLVERRAGLIVDPPADRYTCGFVARPIAPSFAPASVEPDAPPPPPPHTSAIPAPSPPTPSVALPAEPEGPVVVAFRPNGRAFAAGTGNRVSYEMDLKDAETFDLSWDMKRLLGAGKTTAYVWDTATGKLVKSYPLPS